MTAVEFLEYANLEVHNINLFYLTKYLDDKINFISLPDAEVVDRNGEPLAEAPFEPNDFRDYVDDMNTNVIGNKMFFEYLIDIMYGNNK